MNMIEVFTIVNMRKTRKKNSYRKSFHFSFFFFNPIAGCDCYNFCQGEYNGCCKYNTPCTTTCNTAPSINDVTAGCEINPSRPPVVAPRPPPTPKPTPAPLVCPVRSHPELCPTLVANQAPVAGCDCYNYCGSTFAGCCSATDFNCVVNCTNIPHGSQLTAGCILPGRNPPPSCKAFYASCSTNTECCSGRCIYGQCRTSDATVASSNRQHLGFETGQGGAATGNGHRAPSPVGRRLDEED